MDPNFKLVLLIAIVSIGANLVGYLSMVLYVQAKLRGRKPPLGIVPQAIKNLFSIHLKANRRRFSLDDLEGKCLWYIDWDRGFGYGFMQEPLCVGDHIYARYNSKKSMLLLVYKVHQPVEGIPEFFIFRTFYRGLKYEPDKEKFIVPREFQRQE